MLTSAFCKGIQRCTRFARLKSRRAHGHASRQKLHDLSLRGGLIRQQDGSYLQAMRSTLIPARLRVTAGLRKTPPLV